MNVSDITLLELFDNRKIQPSPQGDIIKSLFEYIEEVDPDHLSNLFMDAKIEKEYRSLKMVELIVDYKDAKTLRPIPKSVANAIAIYYINELEYFNLHGGILSDRVKDNILASFVEYVIENKKCNTFVLKNSFDLALIKKYFDLTSQDIYYDSSQYSYPLLINFNVRIAEKHFLITNVRI